MNLDFDYALLLPGMYWFAMVALGLLAVEAGLRWREKWAVPVAMVYLTIFGWYMMEPLNTPESFSSFTDGEITSAYLSVFIFLVALRVMAPIFATIAEPKERKEFDVRALPAEKLFWIVAIGWAILVAIGIGRMQGDVVAALFPIEARNQVSMWQRAAGADAGTFGFAVSIASYLYVLTLAMFGMLLPIIKKRWVMIVCVVLIIVSWPYAFLQGSRNITLAVFLPLIFSFVLFTKVSNVAKGVIVLSSFVFIEWALRQIITFRNVGFDYQGEIADQGHLGLNMASELIYANSFINSGVMDMKWGYGFLLELSNMLPRFLWPDKPLLGIDYAIARGFAGGGGDIGVVATISTGLIGQGVLEFGPYVGPIVMAMFMAIWVAILARWWAQGTVTRICLFMVGMGLTFNIGRNLTLLVLWPMVFAFVVVVIVEKLTKRSKMPAQRAPSMSLPEART